MDEQGSQQQGKKELTDKEVLLIAKRYVSRFLGLLQRFVKGRTKWNLFFTLLIGFDIFLVLQYFSLYLVLLNPFGFYILLILATVLPLILLLILLFHFVSVLVYLIVRRPDRYHTILCIAVLISTGSLLSVMKLTETVQGLFDQIQLPDNAKISEEQAMQLANDCRVFEISTEMPEETKVIYAPLGYMLPPSRTAFVSNTLHEQLKAAVNSPKCSRETGVYYSYKRIPIDEVIKRLDTCSVGDVYIHERDITGIDLLQYNGELATIYVNGPIQTQVLAETYKAQKKCPYTQVKVR